MKNLPEIVRSNKGFSFLVNGQSYIMLAAEVHNSACTSMKYMQNVWKRAEELNCNTILAPVYWELLEPKENQFDFDLAGQLVLEARKHKLKLVLLWFGSWKNGLSTYVPQWVKTNVSRFPRTEDEHGVKTKTLSLFGSDIFPAESNAFLSFMNFIRELDSEEQTVIAVQVENEVGILGALRDFSQNAADEYQKNVPKNLIKYIRESNNSRLIGLLGDYETSLDHSWRGVWKEKADEVFMCYHYAAHINSLAKKGKEAYALPMFTNVWLKEFDDEKPGFYPCGGAVPDMLEVWKCAAADLEVLSPDIYTFQFEKIADLYTRRDNPLLIPETRRDKWAPANLYAAVGTYHTLCYSPFGAESIGEENSFITQIIHTDLSDKNVSGTRVKEYLAKSYKLFTNMMPLITRYYGTDKMIGFVQNGGYMSKHIKLGKYQIKVDFYHQIDEENAFIPSGGIVIQDSENELIFMGYGYRACLETANIGRQLDFLALEKGTYDENAAWVKYMDLNGDEQQIQMEEEPSVLKALYYEF